MIVLIGGIGIRLYEVEPDPEFPAVLAEKVLKFWEHVLNDTPPEEGFVSADLLLRNRKRTEVVEEIEDQALLEVLSRYWDLHGIVAKAEKELAVLKARILEAMGDRRGIRVGPFEARVTTVTQTRFQASKLKAEQPEVYSRYASQCTYNRFEVRRQGDEAESQVGGGDSNAEA